MPAEAGGEVESGGPALRRALRAARAQASIPSDSLLALRSGVHLQTIQNWMYGKTQPRPSEVAKVAKALDKPVDYLLAAYEGREMEPPPIAEAVREQTEALSALTRRLEDLVTELRLGRETQVQATIDLQESLGRMAASLARDRRPDETGHAEPGGNEI